MSRQGSLKVNLGENPKKLTLEPAKERCRDIVVVEAWSERGRHGDMTSQEKKKGDGRGGDRTRANWTISENDTTEPLKTNIKGGTEFLIFK